MLNNRKAYIVIIASLLGACLFIGTQSLTTSSPEIHATSSPTVDIKKSDAVSMENGSRNGKSITPSETPSKKPSGDKIQDETHNTRNTLSTDQKNTVSFLLPQLQGSQDAYRLIAALREQPGGAHAAGRIVSICLEWQEAATGKTQLPPLSANDARFASWRHALATLETACANVPQTDTLLSGAFRLRQQLIDADASSRAMRNIYNGWHTVSAEDRRLIETSAWHPWAAIQLAGVGGLQPWFNGTWYTESDPARFSPTSQKALLVAAELAQCDLGYPCHTESWTSLMNCLRDHRWCGLDVESALHAIVLEDTGGNESAWQVVQPLRRQLVDAVRHRRLSAFVPPGPPPHRVRP